MSLEGYEVWLIIILVIGVIASNIAVLKYSAKFKMPQFGEHKDQTHTKGKETSSPESEDKLTAAPSDEKDIDSKDKTL
ncbi:DUF2897 family protein [Shewanella sp. SG44-2]|jgi:hypothetical protein|uniref:DUF2897 family protein n=1 Tax=Shewanella TaxID=22 RepID=UPI000E8370CE|nr:DUF2897 family protein [Shewanella sp. SG44-2]MBB1426511.1 DUF2897 family protein [Shewanella sp. SG44-2]HBF45307.1 DUF2897 domain-containing protein [Shewanella frigidimarina]